MKCTSLASTFSGRRTMSQCVKKWPSPSRRSHPRGRQGSGVATNIGCTCHCCDQKGVAGGAFALPGTSTAKPTATDLQRNTRFDNNKHHKPFTSGGSFWCFITPLQSLQIVLDSQRTAVSHSKAGLRIGGSNRLFD